MQVLISKLPYFKNAVRENVAIECVLEEWKSISNEDKLFFMDFLKGKDSKQVETILSMIVESTTDSCDIETLFEHYPKHFEQYSTIKLLELIKQHSITGMIFLLDLHDSMVMEWFKKDFFDLDCSTADPLKYERFITNMIQIILKTKKITLFYKCLQDERIGNLIRKHLPAICLAFLDVMDDGSKVISKIKNQLVVKTKIDSLNDLRELFKVKTDGPDFFILRILTGFYLENMTSILQDAAYLSDKHQDRIYFRLSEVFLMKNTAKLSIEEADLLLLEIDKIALYASSIDLKIAVAVQCSIDSRSQLSLTLLNSLLYLFSHLEFLLNNF